LAEKEEGFVIPLRINVILVPAAHPLVPQVYAMSKYISEEVE
jgi:hypothetical protein